MMKERAMAVFIGLIMVFSVAGFAMMGINFSGGSDSQQVQTPSIVDRALTKDEFRSVLLSGKTIIQNHYALDCDDCEATNALLGSFAQGMEGFVVLEQFGVQFQNETKLQLVSSDGKITELDSALLNESSLLDTMCSVSYVQPKLCLLRNIGTTAPAPAEPANQPNATANATGNASGNVSANQTGRTNTSDGTPIHAPEQP